MKFYAPQSGFSVLLLSVLVSACVREPLYYTENTKVPDNDHDRYLLTYYTHVETMVGVSVPLVVDPTKQPITINIAAINKPTDKQYLYFRSNGWYNSSVDFGTNAIGLPNKSDSNSTQQVSAILTDLGSAAAGLFGMTASHGAPVPPPAGAPTAKDCVDALIARAPYALSAPLSVEPMLFFADDKVGWWIFIAKPTDTSGDKDEPTPGKPISGFFVYEPSSVQVTLACYAKGISPKAPDAGLAALPTQTVAAYLVRRLVNPQREFWTSPQDTFTITDGILVGHKYTEQSGARTAVDLITAPIKAILPSVSTQTSTSIQTVDGKPTQTTQSVQVTAGPPKAP